MKMSAVQTRIFGSARNAQDERLARFHAAVEAFNPTLVALQGRMNAIRDTIDYLTYQYCLNETVCEQLNAADAPIDRFMRLAQFLEETSKQQFMTERAKAYHYRELLRVLFELQPPLTKLMHPTAEFAVIKKGAYEMLQFKLNLAVMELDQLMNHPKFMEHAMAIEEIVMTEA